MIGLRNLAALESARERIVEEGPTREGLIAQQAERRRPTPEEQAKAWKARNQELGRVRSITIREPGEAVALWLKGTRSKSSRPSGTGSKPVKAGQTAEEQIVAKVAHTYLTFDRAEGLEAAIEAWPLPMTFYDPAPPLCGVERELLADPRPYSPPPDPEEEAGDLDDGRLMDGMRRADA